MPESTATTLLIGRRALVLLGLGSVCSAVESASDETSAIDQILGRLRAEYAQTVNPGAAADWVQSQSKEGGWPDIDYADRSDARWKPVIHMERTRGIATGYTRPGHALFKAPAARAAVEAALRDWMARKPTSTNWWQNSIGIQLALMPVLVLMSNDLPTDLMRDATSLLYDPSMVPKGQATGQNLVWYASQLLVRGALRRDAGDIAQASRRLQDEVEITPREGIQTDFSFHQHGAQLYTGGYGLGFLMDSVRMAGLLDDTPWAYEPQRLEILAAFALDGVRPLVRGRWLDWGARGREFTRVQQRVSRPQAALPALRTLAGLSNSRQDELAALVLYIEQGAKGPPVLGNRHFWRSDFMVHQTAKGYWSVKMISARTVGTESGNGENLLGFWLPFGTTYLLRRGDEYDGLPPVWDWSRLPGVTAPAEVPSFSGLLRGAEVFVGAVSDGASGAAAMTLNTQGTTGRKAWFCHGDLMVAMGADIHSQRDTAVATTLNQSRWMTDVASDRGNLQADAKDMPVPAATWVWHDGITYLLPGKQVLTLRLQEATGSGREINADLGGGMARGKVFTLALQHGVRPAGASYVYGVWMGAATPGEAGRSPAFTVLSNSKSQQSVRHDATKVVQAVMHEAGSLVLDRDHALSVDQPCLLQATPNADGWRAAVSEPTQKLTRVNLVLRRGSVDVARVEAAFSPNTSSAGRSSLLDLSRTR